MTAEYRSIQTRMWREDEWFQELDTEARLLWIYLFTNPSASPAGIYRLPIRTMSFESGIDTTTIGRLLEQFSGAGKAHYENGVVWVVNMRRLQFPTMVDGSREWQTAVRVAKDIDAIPDCCTLKAKCIAHSGYPIVVSSTEGDRVIRTVSILYQYPIDTPSNYITKQNVTKQNVTIEEPAAVAVPAAQPKPDKPSKKEKEPKPPTEASEMFTRLCFVLFGHQNTSNGGLTDKQRGMLNTESKRLRDAGATPDDLGNWYKQVWRTTWPGNQAGQHPNISQVISGVNAWIEGGRKPSEEAAAKNSAAPGSTVSGVVGNFSMSKVMEG